MSTSWNRDSFQQTKKTDLKLRGRFKSECSHVKNFRRHVDRSDGVHRHNVRLVPLRPQDSSRRNVSRCARERLERRLMAARANFQRQLSAASIDEESEAPFLFTFFLFAG